MAAANPPKPAEQPLTWLERFWQALGWCPHRWQTMLDGKVFVCMRCAQTRPLPHLHHWSAWSEPEPWGITHYEQTRRCLDCGLEQVRRYDEHTW